MARSTNLRIALLWGKPPAERTIAAHVHEALHQAGVEVRAWLPHASTDDSWVAALRTFDLIVHRGVRTDVLEEIRRSAAAAPSAWCNEPTAVRAVADRWAVHATLAENGIAVPDAQRLDRWSDVAERASTPCVVKRVDGSAGRSAGVLLRRDGALPDVAPFPGPYVVQALVPGDGLDRTCYVAGACVFLARKRVDPDTGRSTLVDVVRATDEQRRLARAVGAALGLELYGVDAIAGPTGWSVVDVNAFPGARGVPGIAGAVVGHVLRRARANAARAVQGPSR